MGKHQLAMPVLVAVLVAGAAACNAPSPSASPSGETATADLVTEEVEPGVERIRSDGAGHDLEERHPTFRYDMDNVYVTPDGTVWLSSTYSDTDNEANPPGGLVWALGQSETSQYSSRAFLLPRRTSDNPEALGVTCFETGPTPRPGTSSARRSTPSRLHRMGPSGRWAPTAPRTEVCTTSRPSDSYYGTLAGLRDSTIASTTGNRSRSSSGPSA